MYDRYSQNDDGPFRPKIVHKGGRSAASILSCALALSVTACGAGDQGPSSSLEAAGASNFVTSSTTGGEAASSATTAGSVNGDTSGIGTTGTSATSGDQGNGFAGDAGTGDPGAGDAGVADAIPPRCGSPEWAPAGQVPIAGSTFVRFGGISQDEDSVVWSDAQGNAYVADRASTSDAFGQPVRVNGNVTLADDRAAIAANGRSIVAIVAARDAFVGFERDQAAGAWTQTNGLEFSLMRAMFEGGTTVSSPVLSPDKQSLFFLLAAPNAAPHLYEAKWDAAARSFASPTVHDEAQLQSPSIGQRRRPTGISSDGLTLFFFDEAASIERAAWRLTKATAFQQFADVGNFPEATPTIRCDGLYYQGNDGAQPGLYTAD